MDGARAREGSFTHGDKCALSFGSGGHPTFGARWASKCLKIKQDSEETELRGGEQLIAQSSYILNCIIIWTFHLNAID